MFSTSAVAEGWLRGASTTSGADLVGVAIAEGGAVGEPIDRTDALYLHLPGAEINDVVEAFAAPRMRMPMNG
eukprot:11180989-Lingulodinium_polyedra.AAC.1